MFKPVPKAVEAEIPFNLNLRDLSKWLDELSLKDDYVYCDTIFRVLQNINRLTSLPKNIPDLLDLIYKNINTPCSRLEVTFLDHSFPLKESETKNAELIVWLHNELARAYFLSLDYVRVKLNKKVISLIIYQALSCLYQAFLYMCEVYTRPYPGFWHMSYKLYEKAENLNLLNQKVNGQAKAIQNVFNHILVLELCSTNQFRGRHIKRVDKYLLKYLPLAKVLKEVERKYLHSYCKFDLKSDEPPCRMYESGYETNHTMRFITPVIIAKNMYKDLEEEMLSSNAPNSINRRIMLQVVNTLGMARKRKNMRTKAELTCKGIVGISALFQYINDEQDLQLQISDTEFEEKPSKTPKIFGQWEAPDLDLVPQGDEPAHQLKQRYKTKIWHNKKLDQIFNATEATQDQQAEEIAAEYGKEHFEILDSSPQGRRLLCLSPKIKVKTGDIIGLFPDFTGRIECGLVCRLNSSYEFGTSLGIKLLSLETNAVIIKRPNIPKSATIALFLPATRSLQPSDSIIFNSIYIKTGDIIEITRNNETVNYRLGRPLNETAALMHCKLRSNVDYDAAEDSAQID